MDGRSTESRQRRREAPPGGAAGALRWLARFPAGSDQRRGRVRLALRARRAAWRGGLVWAV